MRLYLHIGTEKTGTTSIQDFLVKNEKKLLDLRFGVTRSAGVGNSRKLASYSMRTDRSDDFFASKNFKSLHERLDFRRIVETEFDEEIRFLEGKADAIIISSEHFHSRCIFVDEIERLKDLLDRYFDEIKIICYFRPQVELATSLYSTALRVGYSCRGEDFINGELRSGNYYYNYDAIYDNWAQVFGEDNMMIRLYGAEHFSGADLIGDFCDCLQINLCESGLLKTEPSNASINQQGQLILRRFNERLASEEGRHEVLRNGFVNWLESNFSGSGYRISSEQESKLQARFEKVNMTIIEKTSNSKNCGLTLKSYPQDLGCNTSVDELIDTIIDLWKVRNPLNNVDVDIIRDSAMKFEDSDVKIAYQLMNIAHKLRPIGPFIKEKLESYKIRCFER